MSIEILSQKATATKINSIKGRSKTLRADIASVAASCFVHAAETGDLTLASKLHAAVSKSFQADVKRYFTTFGPIRFDSKTQQFKKVKSGGQFDLNALDVPFDSIEKAEKEVAEYNRDKELTSIVKFLDTKADRAIAAGDDKMTALMLELAKAIATV